MKRVSGRMRKRKSLQAEHDLPVKHNHLGILQ
jgi:hypothetical protein